MGLEVHDYEYIRSHLDDYQYTMEIAKADFESALPDNIRKNLSKEMCEQGIQLAFYMRLLNTGEMSVPKRCWVCPFHTISFNSIGQMCDGCSMNTDWFVGDSFFASKSKRPDWCPLNKQEVKT